VSKSTFLTVALLLSISNWAYAVSDSNIKRFGLVIGGNPTTLDPASTADADSTFVINQVFDTLFSLDTQGKVRPQMAESFEVSPDKMSYTIKLPSNIRSHSGKKITTQDVIFSLSRRILVDSSEVGGLNSIVGAEDFVLRKTKSLKGLEPISPTELKIRLVKPFPGFLERLADTNSAIVPITFRDGTTPPVDGTGRYRLLEVTPSYIRLEAFKEHPRGAPAIQSIFAYKASDLNTVRKLVDQNLLDCTFPYPQIQVDGPQWKKVSHFSAMTRYLGINSNQLLFSSLELRQALLSVLPVKDLKEKLSGDLKIPSGHFVPYGVPGYIPEEWKPPIEPSLAKQFLLKSKWPQNFELVENCSPKGCVGNIICDEWKKYGIPCKYRIISLKELNQISDQQKIAVHIAKLGSHVPDFSRAFAFFHSEFRYKDLNNDKSLDRIIEEATSLETSAEKINKFELLNRAITERAIVLPIAYEGRNDFYIRKHFNLPVRGVTSLYFIHMEDIEVSP
jgi:oligopeptide transport system substrate-binding protein